jgi:AcrR family transcriptional regulator
MPRTKRPLVAARKEPRQDRSAQLVADILEAAIRVLRSEGARGFTTARVAERAGISVGSLYQYFPNKEAILFRLQVDEWAQTTALLADLLANRSQSPGERLRAVLRAFYTSECEEAPFRRALADAAPLYRDAPEAREHRVAGARVVHAFLAEALPALPARERKRITELLMTTMDAMGERVSENGSSSAAVRAAADLTADVFVAYFATIARPDIHRPC